MKKLFILCFFTLGFVYNSSGIAAEVKEMTIVCDEWEGYTNKDGTGAYWEVVKAVFEPAGIKITTIIVPWKRAEYLIKIKEADAIAGDYYYKEMDGKDYLYPQWHLSVEDDITALYKNGVIENLESLGVKSLSGKEVAWIRGYDYDQTLLKDVTVKKKELSDLQNGIRMLMVGRIDVIIDYKTTIVSAAKAGGIDLNDLTFSYIQNGNKLFVAFANTNKAKFLIKVFDERMGMLVQSGEIEAIYKKWGFGPEKFSKDRYYQQRKNWGNLHIDSYIIKLKKKTGTCELQQTIRFDPLKELEE